MSFYSELATTATELLTEFGQRVTIKKFVTGEMNLNTGVMEIPDPVVFSATGVLLDYVYRTFGENTDSVSLIQGADKRLLMSAGVEITVKDRIVVDNHEFSIVNFKQVNPAGIALIYDVWMKR